MTVFLPWRGEFGTMVLRVCRFIHAYPAETKVVRTKRGFEALFPSATEFIYDWEDVPDLQKNWRLKKREEHCQYMAAFGAQMKAKYPRAELVTLSTGKVNPRTWNYRPRPAQLRGLSQEGFDRSF
jgi:hypothetical protein